MFWDRVAGVYDVFVNVINRKTHQKLKVIVSSLIKPDDTVLECACGTGLLSAVIAPKCRQLTATDFSGKMLKKAEKNCRAFRNITYAQADFKRQFTVESYRQFFLEAGYADVKVFLANGRIPCAVAVMREAVR